MNFFEHQDRARRKTRGLIVLFTLAVVTILIAVNVSAAVVMGIMPGNPLNHLEIYVPATILTLLLIGGGAAVRVGQLRGGGDVVAEAMGAQRVSPQTSDYQLRRLHNVVEEVALASGVPVPQVYVLEDESGINAFAAGYSPTDAAVAVTRGALEQLSRDELQGVIAHEFSHILNGDMRLNIRLMGILFGILSISVIGRVLLRGGRGRSFGNRQKGHAAIVLLGLALMLIGYIGVFFGRLIKASVSRQREFLADAAAVQFTRQPQGIAGALKKIGAHSSGSRLKAADTEEVSHMLFASGLRAFMSLLATHPPLVQRIQALEPDFQARQLDELQPQRTKAAAAPLRPAGIQAEHASTAFTDPASDLAYRDTSTLSPEKLVNSLTADLETPDAQHLQQAQKLIESLPAPLYQAAITEEEVIPLLLALLLYSSPVLQAEWQSRLAPRLNASITTRIEYLAQAATALNPLQRLPLVELALPALRRQSTEKRQLLLSTLEDLIQRQQTLGVFEYALGHLLKQHLNDIHTPHAQRLEGRLQPAACRQALTDLFSVVAFWGHTDPSAARHAFGAGIRILFPYNPPEYQPPSDSSAEVSAGSGWTHRLDQALPQLEELNMAGRRLLIEGLVTTMDHDGQITVDEAELLHTICSYLHIPAPPLQP